MALTKDRAAITQLSASGPSTTLDLTSAYRSTLYVHHVNGTGTITVGATIQVQVQSEAGTEWFDFGGPLRGNLTASAVQEWAVELPDDAGAARIDYTVPTGSTGHTLDAEVGRITGI